MASVGARREQLFNKYGNAESRMQNALWAIRNARTVAENTKALKRYMNASLHYVSIVKKIIVFTRKEGDFIG